MGSLCFADNNRQVDANVNIFHLDVTQTGNRPCVIVAGQQQPSYILQNIAPEMRGDFQGDFLPMPIERYKFCARSNDQEFRELVEKLHTAGVIKYSSNVIMTNLGYKIKSGLRAKGIREYEKYYFLETEYSYDNIERQGHLAPYIRGTYRTSDQEAYWDSMNLYWNLMSLFEEYGESL